MVKAAPGVALLPREGDSGSPAQGALVRLQFLLSVGLLLPPKGNTYAPLRRAPTEVNLRSPGKLVRAVFYGGR
jgi:hypothetical protein